MEGGRVWRLIVFGGSHFGRTLTWVAADVYALYALTTVAGLSAPEAAAVFLCTMALSAMADLGVGWSLDRWGVPRAVVLVSAAIMSSACFAASLTMTHPALAVLAAIGFRLAYAVYDVPHNAMLKRLSHRTDSAVVLSAVRFVTGGASAFAVAGLVGWLVHDRAEGLPVLAAVTAVVAGASMALYAPVIALPSVGDVSASAAITSAQRETPASPAAVVLLLMVALLGAVMGGLVTKSLAFIADADLAQAAWLGRALAIVTTGRLAAAPLWAWVARKIGVLPATVLSFGVVAAGGAVMAASAGSTSTLEIGIGFLGAGFAGVTVCSWALLPDLSASLARRTMRDPIHLTVASYTAVNKLALGVSGGIMATLLGWAGTADGRLLAPATGIFLAAGGSMCVAALAGYLRIRRVARSAGGEKGAEEAGRRRADDAGEGAEFR